MGDGYSEPESVSVVGDDALITERTGALLRQDLNQPGRANAQVVAAGIGALHQVVRSDDGAAALVADHSGGRIVRVDLATGDVSDVLTGLGQPIGLAVGVDGTIFVTQQADRLAHPTRRRTARQPLSLGSCRRSCSPGRTPSAPGCSSRSGHRPTASASST